MTKGGGLNDREVTRCSALFTPLRPAEPDSSPVKGERYRRARLGSRAPQWREAALCPRRSSSSRRGLSEGGEGLFLQRRPAGGA